MTVKRFTFLVGIVLVGCLLLASMGCESMGGEGSSRRCSICRNLMEETSTGWTCGTNHDRAAGLKTAKCPNCNFDVSGVFGIKPKCSNCGTLVEMR